MDLGSVRGWSNLILSAQIRKENFKHLSEKKHDGQGFFFFSWLVHLSLWPFVCIFFKTLWLITAALGLGSEATAFFAGPSVGEPFSWSRYDWRCYFLHANHVPRNELQPFLFNLDRFTRLIFMEEKAKHFPEVRPKNFGTWNPTN